MFALPGRLVTVPASASDALGTVFVRTFAALRALSIIFLFSFVSVWLSWYAGHPAGMAAAAATAAWGATFIGVSLRRGLGPVLATGNVAVAAGLAVSAPYCLPGETIGTPGTWLMTAATHSCVVAAWVFPAWAFAAALAAVAGAMMIGGVSEPSRMAVAVVLLMSLAALFRVVAVQLRRLAARADRRLEVAAARHRAETIRAARARDQRERERILHDTVLNTLTGIGWGGGSDVELAARQCREATVAVRELLDGQPHDLPVGLVERLELAADAARAGGLEVRTTVVGRRGDLPAVPLDVVSAFAAATTELLANVRRHAGTGRARVEVRRDRAAVTVTVRDDGPGFEPARVPADRLGLRQSVCGRIAEVGGRVSVESALGAGTTVLMSWQSPPPQSAPSGSAAGDRPAGRQGSVSAAELRQTYAAGLRRAAGTAAGAWLAMTLVPLVASLTRVRSPALAWLTWLVVALEVVLVIRVIRRRPLSRMECLVLVAVGWAATVASTLSMAETDDVVRIMNWPVFALPLLVTLVAVSRPMVEWMLTLAATVAFLTALVLGTAGTDPLPVSQLIAAVYGQCALLIIAVMAGPVLRNTADRTAQAIGAEAELAALQDSAALVREDRARGLGAVERDVLPLLAAISGGLLDPRDPAVRDRCTRHAAAVRRTLTAGPPAVLGELAPAVADAEARGVRLGVQVCGDLRRAPAQVRRELADQVAGALRTVPSDGAWLTLVCDSAGGSVFLTYPGGDVPAVLPAVVRGSDPAGPSAPSRYIHMNTDLDDGHVCVEIRWDDGGHDDGGHDDVGHDDVGHPAPVPHRAGTPEVR